MRKFCFDRVKGSSVIGYGWKAVVNGIGVNCVTLVNEDAESFIINHFLVCPNGLNNN